MRPTIALADVEMFGALATEGETYRKCRLSILGKPANVVLYSRLLGERRWKTVDTLLRADVTEHADGSYTMTGESQELVKVVGLDPKDAVVRWEVRPRGCSNC
jgi:hypothetical protein